MYGGHDHQLGQTVIALSAGVSRSEHANPVEATVVRDPRSVLAEFGTSLPDDVEITVWDASAESRYAVLPQRPKGTDGLNEEQLAALVTRNGLIGVETR